MRLRRFPIKSLGSALIAAILMSACGGGGSPGTNTALNAQGGTTQGGSSNSSGSIPAPGGSDTPGNQGTPSDPSPPSSASMTMWCVDGPSYQCSGGMARIDNGVLLTTSGVQVYGKSTVDSIGGATGLAPASGGFAEVRIAKNSNGAVSGAALLLDNLGILWDGRNERPRIVETFNPTQGRVQLDVNGALTDVRLPDHTDLNFYDYASKREHATQAHYANNRYFPRDTTTNPARCPADMKPGPDGTVKCDVETTGIQQVQTGDWHNGGITPDGASAARLHEDGDVHAGDDVDGKPLPGGSGLGAPFAGSKGYRTFDNRGFQYANLGTWFTQDTVQIVEWTAGAGIDEHNQNRRGIVAYGDVTDPAKVPAAGSATYSGIVYGWYAGNGRDDPSVFRGDALVTVDFATRTVTVRLQNTVADNGTAVPVALTAATLMGGAGENTANYLTGTVGNGTLNGGLSGRLFGPVDATGAIPPEIGGAFSLSNAAGQTAIGGFIARKQ